MTEVAPIATTATNAVHISELIRTATDVSEITARLLGKRSNSAAEAEKVSAADDDAVTTVNLLDSTDSDGRTAFHWCLALKRFDLAQGLASKGCTIATVDYDKTSTLATACAVDAPVEILTLVAKAADSYVPSSAANSPNASNTDGAAMATSSVHFWNIPDTAGNTPLLYLASRGNVKGLKAVLGMMPQGVTLRYRPVERAEEAKRRHQAAYAAANGSGKSAAAVADDDDAAGPSKVTELSDSASTSPVDLPPPINYCDLFVQNNRLQTALHRAVSKGSQEFVEELLSFIKKHVVSGDAATTRNFVNAPDSQGNTVLHYASLENNEDMGKFLLRNGASRDAKNKKGQEFWQL